MTLANLDADPQLEIAAAEGNAFGARALIRSMWRRSSGGTWLSSR
ncbi:MAG: hypothetical protein R3C68_14230 [Myxococcota bacterium]